MNEQILTIVKDWRVADSSSKQNLIREIVKTGSPDGLKLLSQIVNRDRDIEIRQSARKAYNTLYRYCYPSQDKGEDANPRVSDNQVVKWLRSKDPDLEMKALVAIQDGNSVAANTILRQNYQNFHDDRVKATLVKTLASERKAEDVPICYHFLQDDSPRVRANAIEALEMIDHPNTYMIFVQWLSDSDNRVKANCIKALRKLGQQSVNRILEEMLHSEYTAYKESALYVISLSPSRQGLYLVQNFLSEEYDPALVERAWHLLHEFEQAGVPGAREYIDEYYASDYSSDYDEQYYSEFDPEDLKSDEVEIVLRSLSRILENQLSEYAAEMVDVLQKWKDNSKITSYVIRIFGELCLADFLTQIIPFLNSEDDRVRANAVESVGIMGYRAESLVGYLNDRNNRVRANAIVALSGQYDVGEAIQEMARHDDPLFRKSVLYAIKQVKDLHALPALEELIHDEEVGIRNQALEVLQFYEICGIEGSTEILQSEGQSLYE